MIIIMTEKVEKNGWKIAATVLLTLMVIGASAATILPLHNLKNIDAVKAEMQDVRTRTAVNAERFRTIQAQYEAIKANQERILDQLNAQKSQFEK